MDDDDTLRKIFATAFEPHDEGYAFHRRRKAPGVLVTREEYEALMARPTLSAYKRFEDRVKNRPAVVPPRSHNPLPEVMASLPGWGPWATLGVGVAAASYGVQADGLAQILWLGGAFIMIMLAASQAIALWRARQRRQTDG